MAEGWWRVSPAIRRQGGAGAALSPEAGTLCRPRAAGLGALCRRVRATRIGWRWRACRNSGARRCFRSRPPTSSSVASTRGRRWGPRCTRRKRPGLQPGLPTIRPRSAQLLTRQLVDCRINRHVCRPDFRFLRRASARSACWSGARNGAHAPSPDRQELTPTKMAASQRPFLFLRRGLIVSAAKSGN